MRKEIGTESGLARAFLSYSRNSEQLVSRIHDDLIRCGIKEVWWDDRLVGAQLWWDTILRQIRDADVVVCVIDEGMPESTAVRREYQYAIDLGKPLLPVLLSNHVEISTLPIQLAGKQYVDYRPDCPDPISGLMVAVRNLPPAPPLPKPLPPEPPIPISERDYLVGKISSTEPLPHDVQVDVLSRLRRLERSDESDHREFAQASLRRLRNRPELLASVADDIDAVAIKSVTEYKGKHSLKAGVAIMCVTAVLLIASYLYYAGVDHTKDETESGADSMVATAGVSDSSSNATSSTGSSSSESLSGSSPNSESSESPGEEFVQVPVNADTNAGIAPRPLEDTSRVNTGAGRAVVRLSGDEGVSLPGELTGTDVSEHDKSAVLKPTGDQLFTSSETAISAAISDSSIQSADEETAHKKAPTRELLPAVTNSSGSLSNTEEVGLMSTDQTKSSETTSVPVPAPAGIENEDWDVDFTVFEETSFNLCGYSQFT